MPTKPQSPFAYSIRRRVWVILLGTLLIVGYWSLPIHARVLILPTAEQRYLGAWPYMQVEPPAARSGDPVTIYVHDNVPWPYVKLVVNGTEVQRDERYPTGTGPWVWRWQFAAPQLPSYAVTFYHDCHTGCVARTTVMLGDHVVPTPSPVTPVPTKLGVVFVNPTRDWHGRAGWDVELTYVQRQDDPDFSIDGLARRVQQSIHQNLRILVRIAYDQRQALPPANDEVALKRYLDYCARLVRDDRLLGVYGYVIGSGFNTKGENTQAPDRPTMPEWYARVFNGYGLPEARSDNVVQTMHIINPSIHVLIGPVTPWNVDSNGNIHDAFDQPWLNYLNTLVAHIDIAAQAKSKVGLPFAVPDGFAFQAPGRPGAPEVASQPAHEPSTDVKRATWGNAQAGFRIYQDWLRIINHYSTTQGKPAYITSTNTWTSDTQIPPEQNYPVGWLTTALVEINNEPQIQALCWFVDEPLGEMWTEFSLSRHPGHLNDTAREFDQLLQQ